jgi:hypothetical protein
VNHINFSEVYTTLLKINRLIFTVSFQWRSYMKRILFFISFLLTALAVHSQTNIVITDKFDRTPIEIADLQNHITTDITRDHPGFIINQATRVVKSNVITYEIVIVQGTTTDTLFFDQNYVLTHTTVHTDSIKPAEKVKK